MKDGARENSATVVTLLEDLIEGGIDPARRYLFVVEGARALRSAGTAFLDTKETLL